MVMKKKYELGIIEHIAREKLRLKSSKRVIYENLAVKTGCTWWTVAKYDKGCDIPFSFLIQLADAYHTSQLTPKYLFDTYREYMNQGRVRGRRKSMR